MVNENYVENKKLLALVALSYYINASLRGCSYCTFNSTENSKSYDPIYVPFTYF